MIKRSYLCGGSVLAVVMSLGLAGPLAAQPRAANETTDVEEVVVTGSYIAGTPEDSALPVDVLSSTDLEEQGSPTVVQLVKTITASGSGIGESNRYNGGAGTASINLRGFGASRTLSLMNGRRMADSPAASFQGGGADLNFIPSAAIGRVEILKDGAAATYGSDAVGGVVNFITRRDLDAFEVEGEYSFIDGSSGDWFANAAWGSIFEGGNVLVTAGYRRRGRLDIDDRSWARQSFDLGGYNGAGGWTGAANPGFYQNASTAGFLFRDNGCEELGGTLTNTVAVTGPGGTATIPVPVSAQNPVAANSVCRYQFSNFNDLVNEEHHYQAHGEINFEFVEGHSFHAEATWNRNWVPDQRISPANLNTQFPTPTNLGGESGSLRPPGALNFFVPFNVPSNNPGLIALYTNCAAPLTGATCTAIQTAANTPRTGAFAGTLGGSRLNTQGIDISQTTFRTIAFAGHPTNRDGADHQDIEQTEWRVSGGFKGELPWYGISYDAAATYMEAEQQTNTNDLLVNRIQLALNGYGSLSTDPGSCNAAERLVAANAGNNAVGCYFFNPFTNGLQTSAVNGATNPFFRPGLGNDPRVVENFYGNYTNIATNRLFVFDLVFNGRTGIELGGGEIAWAAGYQWRWNQDKNEYGDFFNNEVTPCVDSITDGTPVCGAPNGPLIFFGSNSNFDQDRSVWAVFGEISLPVLENVELNLAVRHEDYPGGIGSTTNPKLAVKWQVVDWLALRGSASTTFRAPTIAAASSICATGVALLSGQYRAVRTCGNSALKPEEADTFNVGGIVQFGGFTASLDYFNFDFTDELTIESSSRLFATMFPATGPNGCNIPELAARFQFAGGVCSAANVLRVDVNNVNGPSTKTSGFDFRAQYEWDDFLLDGSRWSVGMEATYLLEYKRGAFTLNGAPQIEFAPAEDRAGLHDLTGQFFSYPETRANGWLSFNQGPWTARWQVRYTEGTSPAFGTTLFVTVPDSAAAFGRRLEAPGKSDDYWQHDVIVRWEAPWDALVTLSVQNIFDEDPPYAASQYNYDYTNGNPLGRVFEIGVKKQF